jgi:type IV secretion system protein VirB4
MIRANTEYERYTPWFAKAGAACSIIPISRFVNERIFALKGGGYPLRLALALCWPQTRCTPQIHIRSNQTRRERL